jgi:hypothetical protein
MIGKMIFVKESKLPFTVYADERDRSKKYDNFLPVQNTCLEIWPETEHSEVLFVKKNHNPEM